eukprot:gnl/MRDRNA2_/MRDRNA2_77685_c0_seq2.p1 gnl/MRDRNA2_/MRDRNA2_77685_c0~~gnl/MRDRNA2_/MRDRNA2_77685_c0_seq2.p1  ORF type:complete len:272 (-),score=63.23 gnl/MRDRNA2_/MRDRNA2_77685_c0_seq2:80-895(-)
MAKRCAGLGMRVFLADNHEVDLVKAVAAVTEAAGGDASKVSSKLTDVGDMSSVQSLKEEVYAKFGEVGFLMSNAAISGGGGPFEKYENWQKMLQVNLWGVINCVHAFTDAMIAQKTPCLMVNTGSKQGITCPPGDTAYNISKAGVKILTEGLQHSLRNMEGCQVSAHLLVPGWTNTAMGRKRAEREGVEFQGSGESNPAPGAWSADEVVDFFMKKLAEGQFYIICPDNEVTTEIDMKRIAWSAGDIPKGRPPLSRWHPDYKEEFEVFMKAD